MRTKARALWRRWGVRVVLAVEVLASLAFGAYTAAQHVADSLTVTVRTRVVSCSGPPSCLQQTTVLFRKTFADAGTIHTVQDIINDDVPFKVPGDLEFANGICGYLTDIAYDYDLQFQWLGVTVQEARVNTWCPEWDIHTLGVPDALNRFGGIAGSVRVIARVTHMPQPPPGAYDVS
jgi:hypothetical protein